MLHTLNEAWAKILIEQVKRGTKSWVLFVCDSDNSEMEMAIKLIEESGVASVCLTNEILAEIAMEMDASEDLDFEMPMFDDILVSHKVHNVMLKDFLGRHCKQKCC